MVRNATLPIQKKKAYTNTMVVDIGRMGWDKLGILVWCHRSKVTRMFDKKQEARTLRKSPHNTVATYGRKKKVFRFYKEVRRREGISNVCLVSFPF